MRSDDCSYWLVSVQFLLTPLLVGFQSIFIDFSTLHIQNPHESFSDPTYFPYGVKEKKKQKRERRELASTSHHYHWFPWSSHDIINKRNNSAKLLHQWMQPNRQMYTCSVAQLIFTNYTTLNLLVNYPPNSIIK